MSQASTDEALLRRISACVNQEARDNPELSETQYAVVVRAGGIGYSQPLVWPVVIATEDEYASALAADNPNPGGDESVITDQAIVSAVQASWPPDPAALARAS